MGSCSTKFEHIKQIHDVNVLSKTEREYLLKHNEDSKDTISVVRLSQLLLINGYIHSNAATKIPIDLIFICCDFYILSDVADFLCFSNLDRIINNNVNRDNRNFLKNSKKSKSSSIRNLHKMEITMFEKGNILYPINKTIKIPENMKPLKPESLTLCYVPNISLISKDIRVESPAIIRCGQLETSSNKQRKILRKRLSYKYNDSNNGKDYCSGIIFNGSNQNGSTINNQELHGIEIKLPSFQYSVCDDMIYYADKGLIGYQSFDNGPNKLYYLNNKHSEWRLLTKISWTALSPAILCKLENKNKLFVTTKAGQSVVYDINQNEWQRTPNMLSFDINNDNIHCLTYNESLNKVYRGINGVNNKYYNYSLYKNKWYNIANMTMNDIFISNQILFYNQQSPNVLNTVFSASHFAKCSHSDFKFKNNNFNEKANVFTAYFDERDISQKWTILSTKTNKKYCIKSIFV